MLKRKARIGKSKIKKLAACFAEDLTATKTAKLIGVNRNTANSWYRHFRERILAHQENNTPFFKGEIELDESYFGGPRKKKHAQDRRKRGRGDRKSTRLNSSHSQISYAVFCLNILSTEMLLDSLACMCPLPHRNEIILRNC